LYCLLALSIDGIYHKDRRRTSRPIPSLPPLSSVLAYWRLLLTDTATHKVSRIDLYNLEGDRLLCLFQICPLSYCATRQLSCLFLALSLKMKTPEFFKGFQFLYIVQLLMRPYHEMQEHFHFVLQIADISCTKESCYTILAILGSHFVHSINLKDPHCL
jgi:hypothetical protein